MGLAGHTRGGMPVNQLQRTRLLRQQQLWRQRPCSTGGWSTLVVPADPLVVLLVQRRLSAMPQAAAVLCALQQDAMTVSSKRARARAMPAHQLCTTAFVVLQ